MNGLGIVIEEKEMETDGGATEDRDVRRGNQTALATPMATPESESEILLPPLPDEDAGAAPSSIFTEHKASVSTSVSNESCLSLDEMETGKESQFNEFLQNPTYELNSPSLNIDPLFANLALGETQSSDQLSSLGVGTSPLKRLKNFKKGIRKISLSKMNTPIASSVTPGISSTVRPGMSPIITTGEHIDSYLSVSTAESLHSATKARKSSLITPMTTPLSSPMGSPIITLSENMSSSSKNIADLERNFFRNLNNYDSTTEVSTARDLNKLDDLINYLNFLNKLKVQVIDAFELTKERLIKFGWCSNDDLNNLQFQKDSSLLQIDTRILQVEKKLNKQYNTSILLCSNNRVSKKMDSVSSNSSSIDNFNYASENSKASSLSLKNLESRCFSYPDI